MKQTIMMVICSALSFNTMALTCGPATHIGTNLRDIIQFQAKNPENRSTIGADSIYGNDGNDSLYGHDGADCIDGGSGFDDIGGGNDNDQLFGGLGNDVLYGSNGNDIISGGQGNDELWGGPGHDTLVGDVGFDECNDDQTGSACESGTGVASKALSPIIKNKNVELIVGGSGDDTIIIEGPGNYELFGGEGNDKFIIKSNVLDNPKISSSVSLNDGEGSNRLIFDSLSSYDIVWIESIDKSVIAQDKVSNQPLIQMTSSTLQAMEYIGFMNTTISIKD